MWVHHGASGIEARTPAKLNLLFEVHGRRDDGYHEIETLMVPVSLFDSLSFRPVPANADGPGPISLDCRWASIAQSPSLPSPEKNLAFRAVDLLRRRAGIEAGAEIRLIKRIPLESGLGGGSSDAAAALVAANLGWGLNWDQPRLAAVAAELGSDVPFFLYGGAAICRGRGERVEPVACPASLHAVIVRPPVGLSTAEVYGRCRAGAQRGGAVALCHALRQGSITAVGKQMHNGLQSAAAELSPWVDRLASELRRIGCLAHQLTGSGSSYFGLFRSASAARRGAAQLAARHLGKVFVVRQVASPN